MEQIKEDVSFVYCVYYLLRPPWTELLDGIVSYLPLLWCKIIAHVMHVLPFLECMYEKIKSNQINTKQDKTRRVAKIIVAESTIFRPYQ